MFCIIYGNNGENYDNHMWFEVYDDNGYWSFCNSNACGNYNESWFYPNDTNCQGGNTNYTIWAQSYKNDDTDGTYVFPWNYNDNQVPAYDVTTNYQTN